LSVTRSPKFPDDVESVTVPGPVIAVDVDIYRFDPARRSDGRTQHVAFACGAFIKLAARILLRLERRVAVIGGAGSEERHIDPDPAVITVTGGRHERGIHISPFRGRRRGDKQHERQAQQGPAKHDSSLLECGARLPPGDFKTVVHTGHEPGHGFTICKA
jgi:hypothetical protein